VGPPESIALRVPICESMCRFCSSYPKMAAVMISGVSFVIGMSSGFVKLRFPEYRIRRRSSAAVGRLPKAVGPEHTGSRRLWPAAGLGGMWWHPPFSGAPFDLCAPRCAVLDHFLGGVFRENTGKVFLLG